MKDKLPKVYANKIEKKVQNNEKVFHLTNDSISGPSEEIKNSVDLNTKTVMEKIKELFNSPSYIYKLNVEIKTKNGVVNKHIIGKNKKNLITFENELIPIEDIIDIKLI